MLRCIGIGLIYKECKKETAKKEVYKGIPHTFMENFQSLSETKLLGDSKLFQLLVSLEQQRLIL